MARPWQSHEHTHQQPCIDNDLCQSSGGEEDDVADTFDEHDNIEELAELLTALDITDAVAVLTASTTHVLLLQTLAPFASNSAL